MKSTLQKCALCAAILLWSYSFLSCEGEDGSNGINSLVSTVIETNGENCPAGGLRVNYGPDNNANGVLDTDEIQHSDYVCNGNDGINGSDGVVNLDNLTRILLGTPDMTVCSTTSWFLSPHETWRLHDFNKHDYANVSSILFVPSMATPTAGNVVTVELYNVTDGKPIQNTQLSHDGANYVFKYSENIYDNLPDYPITLAIRLKNSAGGGSTCGTTGTYSYLYILRE